MTATDLPPGQLRVYLAILEHYAETGTGPTYRELMRRTGITTTNGIASNLKPLARKGLITLGEDKARAIGIPSLSDVTRTQAGAMLETVKGGGR